MIFGNVESFAIECQLVEPSGRDIYAHFRLWINGQSIGDYEESVFLKASLNWLIQFMQYSNDRCEPSLEWKDKVEVFRLIFDSVMLTVPQGLTVSDIINDTSYSDTASPDYPNARERFHLDQVGMSSFSDKWNVILVENNDSSHRLIWRNLQDMQMQEAVIPPDCFEKAATQFIEWASSLV